VEPCIYLCPISCQTPFASNMAFSICETNFKPDTAPSALTLTSDFKGLCSTCAQGITQDHNHDSIREKERKLLSRFNGRFSKHGLNSSIFTTDRQRDCQLLLVLGWRTRTAPARLHHRPKCLEVRGKYLVHLSHNGAALPRIGVSV
jgi:hypothetical protein